jgi:sugar phosphate isomerase/epimerase
MPDKIARRQFLKTAAAGAVAGAALGTPLHAAAQADSSAASTDPAKMPRLFSGCCAYSFRSLLTKGQMTYEQFIEKAVEMRLDGVDMTAYYFKSTDPAYLAHLRWFAYKNAMPFSGAACGSSMVQADPAKRAAVLDDIRKWVDVTDQLGASHLRVFAGKLPEGATLKEATGWVVDTLKVASDYSGKKGIVLGLEDHGGVSQSADVCLEIMHRVDSPYARINLDITHFIPSATQDAYAQIAACIPYATVSHIRDHFDDGTPIDMDRVWKLYADAGHKGYMSVEYEGDNHGGVPAEVGVPKLVAKVRELCRKYSTV